MVNEAVLKTTKRLGLTQVIIGVVSILFGVLSAESLDHSLRRYSQFGLDGIWVVIGGLLCICSASNTSNPYLIRTTISVAIVSSFHGFISFIFYCIAIGYYSGNSFSYDDTAIVFFSVLLVLSLVEFITAITVASYFCKFGCSGCCCNDETQMVNEAVLKRKRSLGITQVIIGVLSILFGILSVQSLDNSRHRYGHSGWGGIWVVIGGLLCIFSASNTSNPYLNWTNISFAIVSSFHGFISFILYCIAIGYYNDKRYSSSSDDYTAIAFLSVLLVLSLVEFITAIAVASYNCKFGCSGCCYTNETQVVVIHQQHHFVPLSAMQHTSSVSPAPYPVNNCMAGPFPAASYPIPYLATTYPLESCPVPLYPPPIVPPMYTT